MRLRVTEVGPRDGLQNDPRTFTVEQRVQFIDALSEAGFAEIEAGSFVSPKAVPKMAGSGEVFSRIRRRAGTVYSALVPNERGLDDALAAKVDKVSVFLAASETLSQRNGGASIAQTLARTAPVVVRSHAAGLPVRGYISCVVQCPYEGVIDPAAVSAVAESLLEMGADEIDLGDTIGAAHPDHIERLVGEVVASTGISLDRLTLHLHDTGGRALACAERGVRLGICSFDSSAGGLGGCPYAPGAPGNLATERLLARGEELGWECGVDLAKVRKAVELLQH
ncbi:MAG: hydroxymethylglutaryl-CoA lyase [Planctomycetota bacterium]|nr:hydroxymethylglutaryl-CoA lyase [Planctomycetota bacterium]